MREVFYGVISRGVTPYLLWKIVRFAASLDTGRLKTHAELDIKRIYCVSDERYLYKRVRYFNPRDYDELVYLAPSFDGWYKRIYFRNCAMIDKSDYVILYAEEREGSGAYKAYKYAKRKKDKHVVNLFGVGAH